MAPTLPAKSPRMSPHKLHHEHPVLPITQPQQEIIIDQHEENGREVGGIVYHPLGKGKVSPMKERVRRNEGMGEGAGWERHDAKGPHELEKGYTKQVFVGQGRGQVGNYREGGHDLQRQPRRDTQKTGPSPLPLPPAHTAQHHPSANHHHHTQQPQPHVNTSGGPRLFIQPPTPDNPSPPPALQVRSLNTPPTNQIGQVNVDSRNEGPHSKSKPKGKGQGQGGDNEQGGGGVGIMSRFKTTFLSKNKGPMSKTWARKSYLDELESMAPTSPRLYTASEPVSPAVGSGGDLESGRQGLRRIT
jgi:hypothetical protein